MADLYPLIAAYDHGHLDVGDGNRVYWELAGNPHGKPALVVHGGPGQGCLPGMRRVFDPARYRVVTVDQRGCGQSTPHASEPSTDMRWNTTWHLVGDLELLRAHLGIERWLLCGASWGVTLALAYAETHPQRVSEMVLFAITTGRRAESNWLYRGVARLFPGEFEHFCEGVAASDRDGDLASAYARLMDDPDPGVRERASLAWCAWEDAIVSLEPNATPAVFGDMSARDRLAFVRICAHYVAHGAWLAEGALLRDAGRLAGIPGVLIHGRLDLSCPMHTAWELARAWPGATLIALKDSGHLRSDARRDRLIEALDAFANR